MCNSTTTISSSNLSGNSTANITSGTYTIHSGNNIVNYPYNGTITIPSNFPYNTTISPSVPYNNNVWVYPPSINTQIYDFLLEDKYSEELILYIKDVYDENFIFNTGKDKYNRIQPLETIFKLINRKITFDVKIDRTDCILIIKNVKFVKINNLMSSNSISSLSVKYENDGIEFDNTSMDITLKRREKIEKIMDDLR